MNKVQAWWYVTRAAGLTGYLLIWLSMVWGLAVSSHILQPVLESAFAYDFHEFLSWAGLAFVGLHVTVLMLDKYLTFSLAQVLIPFLDSYRPLWVGLGVISSYVLLLVTVTFYLRKQLGSGLFRGLHVLSLVGYVGATAHGLWAGTDSALGVTRILYAGSFLVVVFLTAHWLVLKWLSARERRAAEAKWQDRRRPRFQARSRP
jgi:predicted ferric reductase